MLGRDYTVIEGADAPGVLVSRHFAVGIEPGTYQVRGLFRQVPFTPEDSLPE